MCNLTGWYGEGEHVIFLTDLPGLTYTLNTPNTWNEERADPYEFGSREAYALQLSRLARPGLPPDYADQYSRYFYGLFGVSLKHDTPKEERTSKEPIVFLEA
jgi:hypothetical protein